MISFSFSFWLHFWPILPIIIFTAAISINFTIAKVQSFTDLHSKPA